MAHDRIPIQLTHEEARAHLESAHLIDYRDSMLGSTVYAFCRCGWKSPSVNAGFIAQAAANRHRIAFIEHPLENRARYAIYREHCLGCGGTGWIGPLVPCPVCLRGSRWMLLDREVGQETWCVTQSECVSVLRTEAGR